MDHLHIFSVSTFSTGCICFSCLGFVGSCQVLLLTYYFVGSNGLENIIPIFGI